VALAVKTEKTPVIVVTQLMSGVNE